MRFFSFGPKLEGSKDYSFDQIPLFSSLSPSELRLVEKRVRLAEFKRGDVVYQEGGTAEAFYVIVSGRFRVFQKVRGEEEKTLTYLYRGDYFGESSLLTDQSHSASVEARSHGLVLKIEKEHFLKILADIPALSIHLSRTLGHRLTKIEGPGKKKQEVKIAALYGQVPPSESFQFFYDLATNLARETKSRVIFIDFLTAEGGGVNAAPLRSRNRFSLTQGEPARESDLKPALTDCPAGFCYLPVVSEKEAGAEKKLTSLITFLSYRFDFLLIRICSKPGDLSFQALKQSDSIYILLDPAAKHSQEAVARIREVEKEFGFTRNEIKIIFPERGSNGNFNYVEKEEELGYKIFHVLPSRTQQPDRYHAALRFVTKELAGTLIGLALGSGAAYGLAHIGVLRVLEKENIPIDVLSGSSMGALVACLWAAGYRSAELEKIAKGLDRSNAFFKLLGFRDLSMAHRGFFHGRQVKHFMESYLGNRTFQDLKMPVKVIASSLTTSRQVVFEKGRVVEALRASISIPGIFRPCSYRGELLIDGGILNPLPVDVLAQMGVKKIIAVNVLCGPKERTQKSQLLAEKRKKLRHMNEAIPMWKKLLMPISSRMDQYFSGNIFNVIMNTIQFMEYEIAEVASQDADVLIQPVAVQGHWAEFYRSDKFIREGEKKTLEQIDEIKSLLVE